MSSRTTRFIRRWFFCSIICRPLRVIIATRADPPLPLARLRARDQLTEIRAADLRFTPDEAAAFFSQAMRLNLSADDSAALTQHTEGWIAGLQLAALSLQSSEDVPVLSPRSRAANATSSII